MTAQDLTDCHKKIKPYIHKTPVLTSRLLNQISGAELYFKCENFQRMGAFKMRGATHAILQLSDEQKSKGVVTHSSGNFAQALSLAAQSLGIKAYIVMPSNAPQVKKDAVAAYDGQITECPPTHKDREETAKKIQQEKGATFLHPYNDSQVILGQGTAALELLEDYPNIEYLFAPVGGGGLIAGTALAASFFSSNCTVIGGEPFEVDDAYRALQSGRLEINETTNTVADGLKMPLGDITFPIIKKHVSEIIRVDEKEIISAMQLIWERMKIVIEPSCAVPLAALLREKERFKRKKIGLILSGGNVDLGNLPF
ncbi:pyridoxal-phosphate dependent enzyme [Aquimarina sp. 2201CG14-23]|uniref:pyridoxal-phosphate dependent enzyme n=1 Tax=Aquimarina mycalae TaxID=3040073 RepID=UPI002477E059|nr:pyridoxal-phosphate dependent enzyme [Aquimarina sp. 2201CG14-23]MDH7448173.1 pyridoxal-phosphate dependent enzyme [Aquimarina sp. 2201CG14-23]